MRWVTLLLVALSAGRLPAQIPDPVLPAGVGVNIHFITGHERDLDLIAAAGFKFIRMDFIWEHTERTAGQYDWSGYETLTANLEKRGLRALYILDYSNPLYETALPNQPGRPIAAPQRPESQAAFARWAAAAAQHFRGRRILWEIWNEPNLAQFWKPKPDPAQYAALALATAKAIRAADPQAGIVAPAISGFDPPFMEKFLPSGVLEYLDGVSVHPYRRSPPETAAAEYGRLRAEIDRYAPKSKRGKIPILSGEWGYSTDGKDVSLETQAAYAVRQQLFNLSQGVPLSIWYDWKNDGPDPTEREHNFGLVQMDLTPKPAYRAMETLTRELAGYRFLRRYDVGREQDYVLVMGNAARDTKLAVWTLGKPHPVTLRLAAQRPEVSVVSSTGLSNRVNVTQGQLTLTLHPDPQYVVLGKTGLKP